MLQKVCARATVRKQPEIFCFTFGMRIARSARWLVKGTRRSVTKRSTASACPRIPNYMATNDVIRQFTDADGDMKPGTPEAMTRHVAEEIDQWRRVIKTRKIEVT